MLVVELCSNIRFLLVRYALPRVMDCFYAKIVKSTAAEMERALDFVIVKDIAINTGFHQATKKPRNLCLRGFMLCLLPVLI